MPRRRVASKQPWIPDPIYQDDQITQFMNIVMRDGKKAVAEGIVYGALRTVEDRTKDEPLKLFKRAVENCQPMVEVKSRRVGGANYQVPVEVRPERRVSLAMRWIVQYARERSGRSMVEKLANEILEAAHNRGNAIKKRDDVHRMADANKAFAHYRW
ncbi:MAG TPA: 30S ribosomal protein S7 [Myxococcota bacterium]|jgi:small subunit ribosomal protein S7|nr:30S ribosomal protein S7 [Myxococcota bacterium]HNH45936.1 30S ribosomal protein S7 [Myxococcota bacterium]